MRAITPRRSERRHRRADVPAEALRLYLDSVAERARRAGRCLSALVLCDETGWLVGSLAGDRELDLPRVAAVGRWCAAGLGPLGDELEATGGEDLFAHPLPLHGRALTLTSVGARVRSVRTVAADVARILG